MTRGERALKRKVGELVGRLAAAEIRLGDVAEERDQAIEIAANAQEAAQLIHSQLDAANTARAKLQDELCELRERAAELAIARDEARRQRDESQVLLNGTTVSRDQWQTEAVTLAVMVGELRRDLREIHTRSHGALKVALAAMIERAEKTRGE